VVVETVPEVVLVELVPVAEVSVMPVSVMPVAEVSVVIVSVDIVIDVSVVADVMDVSVVAEVSVAVASMFVSSFLQATIVTRASTASRTRSFFAIFNFSFFDMDVVPNVGCIEFSRLGALAHLLRVSLDNRDVPEKTMS
jgi:hypothetical protein